MDARVRRGPQREKDGCSTIIITGSYIDIYGHYWTWLDDHLVLSKHSLREGCCPWASKLSGAERCAASRISRARPHSGTRCWRFAVIRLAGTVHTPSLQSISAHSPHVVNKSGPSADASAWRPGLFTPSIRNAICPTSHDEITATWSAVRRPPGSRPLPTSGRVPSEHRPAHEPVRERPTRTERLHAEQTSHHSGEPG